MSTDPHHPHNHHHSSGVSSSLSLFISVPERDACHVINRGFLNACVTHALIRKAEKKKAGAREERWGGRPGRHVEGEQSGRQMGRETDRRTGSTWEGGGGNNVLRAARKTVTYMSRGKVSDFPRAS